MNRFLSLCVIFLLSFSVHSKTLLVLGDSLSAGYQMPIEQSWPSLLELILHNRGHKIQVVNGSISGDTTGNGLARLPKLLAQHNPQYVIVELGANDGLRGFHTATVKKNLSDILDTINQAGAKPLLMQIEVPPNYGKRYSKAFRSIYPELSDTYAAPIVPFFLEQVIVKPEWMKKDGLHPKAIAQPWIAEFVFEHIEKQL
ncbi:arylesterase [Aliivibrio kagoshimensis]|uniref:arylesterase n=1 Tax=Aliivibrio kagoshimensis TaxID=2910230 RepID=UPI003D099123